MNKSREHARLLMEKAAEDLYVLRRLIGDPDAPDAAIGFHAQQAVEKLLKAVLTRQAISYSRTHDLAALLDLLEQNGIALPPDADRLPGLTPYAAEFRYGRLPPEGDETGSFDRAWGVACVGRTNAWAESVLGEGE